MDDDDRRSRPDEIRALLDEVDRVCAEAEFETRRLHRALNKGAFWPERRQPPRRWGPDDVLARDRDES